MANKPNKSILKRIKISSTGKISRRKTHQNHFNAKESRTLQHRHGQSATFSKPFEKMLKKYI